MALPRLKRLGRSSCGEEGFTLLESLIVLLVLAILLAIAVPQYLSITESARDARAKTDIRMLALVAEVYYQDNDGTQGDADGRSNTTGYRGMTIGLLRSKYNPSLPATLSFRGRPSTGGYCARARVDRTWWSAAGPGVTVSSFKKNNRCR